MFVQWENINPPGYRCSKKYSLISTIKGVIPITMKIIFILKQQFSWRQLHERKNLEIRGFKIAIFCTTLMNMFVKFIWPMSSSAFTNVIIQTTSCLLPGFTCVCFNVTHVTYQVINNVYWITVDMASNFPCFSIGANEGCALLNTTQQT